MSQVSELEDQSQLGLVVGGFRYVNELGQPLAECQPWQFHPELDLLTLLKGAPIVPSAVLIRQEWLDHVGAFDSLLRQGEDVDLWLRLAYHGCRMAWSQHQACAYRIHGGQLVQDGRIQKNSILAVLDKFFSLPALPADVHTQREYVYAVNYLTGAFREYAAQQVDDARASVAKAIELAPALIAGTRPSLADALISWAVDPVTGDPASFVERVIGNLPASASRLTTFRQQILTAAAIRAAIEAGLVGNSALAHQHLLNVYEREKTLFDEPTLVIEQLIDCVHRRQPESQDECVESFFENLPHELASLRPWRRKALGRLYMARGFRAHNAGSARDAGRAIWQGVRLDPSWLRNRGVWSILGRSIIR
jgi:hypothetical protein